MKKPQLATLVRSIRESSRSMVRELGMLGEAHASLGLTNSQVHALIELEKDRALSVIELAERLHLEKSSVSRLIDALQAQQLIKAASDAGDARRKLVSLTSAGERKLVEVHAEADGRVERALSELTPREQELIARGIDLYARALKSSLRKVQDR